MSLTWENIPDPLPLFRTVYKRRKSGRGRGTRLRVHTFYFIVVVTHSNLASLPVGGAVFWLARVVLLATAQALMGQWALVTVARHLADPQSHSRALPSLDTAGGEAGGTGNRLWTHPGTQFPWKYIGSHSSKHAGTKGCSDNWNVCISEKIIFVYKAEQNIYEYHYFGVRISEDLEFK